MPPDHADLLTSLKIVAQVRAGGRLSTRGATIEVDSRSGLTQAAARWWVGETRHANLDQLAKIVSAAIAAADARVAPRLRGELRHAAEGLANLRLTYRECSISTARLDVLLENIEEAVGGGSAGSAGSAGSRDGDSVIDEEESGG